MKASFRRLCRIRLLAIAKDRRGQESALHWYRRAMEMADVLKDMPAARARDRLNVERLSDDLSEGWRLANQAHELAGENAYVAARALRAMGLNRVGHDDSLAVILLERTTVVTLIARMEGHALPIPAGPLTMLYARLGETSKAIEWGRLHIELLRAGNASGVRLASAYRHLASLRRDSGDLASALRAAEAALAAIEPSDTKYRKTLAAELSILVDALRSSAAHGKDPEVPDQQRPRVIPTKTPRDPDRE